MQLRVWGGPVCRASLTAVENLFCFAGYEVLMWPADWATNFTADGTCILNQASKSVYCHYLSYVRSVIRAKRFVLDWLLRKRNQLGDSRKLGPETNSTQYWSEHTVAVFAPASARESLDYFHWRVNQYPGYLELAPVAGLDNLDVVDFGCGPGHDLVGIGHYSRPKSLMGFDVSELALGLARKRLDLNDFGKTVETRLISNQKLDIADESVDYIHSSGVLHHVPDLPRTLEELHRVLRHNGRIRVMVYNRESLWWNLYVPHVLQLKRREIPLELPIREAFRMSTDGLTCPISEAYTLDSFRAIASKSGFRTSYVGASISLTELEVFKHYSRAALRNSRLAVEHREFLRQVRCAKDGTLSRNGEIPGINLVLELIKEPARDGPS